MSYSILRQKKSKKKEDSHTDNFLFNLVQGMVADQKTVPPPIGHESQDPPKVVTEQMYSDNKRIGLSLDNLNKTTDLKSLGPADVLDDWTAAPPTPASSESIASLCSPMASPASFSATPSDYESTGSISQLPMSSSISSEEKITLVVSPSDVFGELSHPKRKRGRRPKSLTAICAPTKPREPPRKTKVYEIDQPFVDKVKERKRLNAVNAKRHRDLQKQAKAELEQEILSVMVERDILKKEVAALRAREEELHQQLDVLKEHFRNQAHSVITLLSAGHVSL